MSSLWNDSSAFAHAVRSFVLKAFSIALFTTSNSCAIESRSFDGELCGSRFKGDDYLVDFTHVAG
jgi:hypothetical protein